MKDRQYTRKDLIKYGAIFLLSFAAAAALFLIWGRRAEAANLSISLGNGTDGNGSDTLDVLLLFLFLAVVPSLVVMMTSFTRIIIVLSFMRNALGTQQSPPNQILVGLALVLTVFIMSPVISKVNTNAYEPYKEGTMTRQEALKEAEVPVKEFMLKQTEKKSLDLIMSISKTKLPKISKEAKGIEKYMPLSITVLTPAFVLSELNRAFTMGFLIFIPFLIIDMVVASTLMSMGMVMLPPTMIALPFKIMLFVLVGGWDLVIKTLVQGFK